MLPDDPRHGSERGYQAHRRTGKPACAECRAAHSVYTTTKRLVPHDIRDDRRRARLEDLEWMAATGENADNAAVRLGISFDALEGWARQHAPETWRQLIARRPRDWNQRLNRGNQHGSAA